MLHIKDISLVFSVGTSLEKSVLSNLSLTIEKGEFTTIIGSNGAGKSSLLKCISGKYALQKGSIHLDNTDITRYSEEKRAQHISQIFQDPLAGTCGELTIEENMALAASRGKSRGLQLAISSKDRYYFAQKLCLLNMGLENRLAEKINRLSGGQRQAVSLLMASLQPAKVWLFDEHTSALDPQIAKNVMELTTQLIDTKNSAILMVTHSMQQALSYGNRTIMLDKGKIIFDAKEKQRSTLTPESLIKKFSAITQSQLDHDKLLLQ